MRTLTQLAAATLYITIALIYMSTTHVQGNNIVADLKNKISENVCIMDEDCNKFLKFENYCCSFNCCHMFKYITRNDDYWENIQTVIYQKPRPFNIGLLICSLLILILVLAIIIKLVSCLCCGCCGSKKYVVVGRGD